MINTPEKPVSRRTFLRRLVGIEGLKGRFSLADTARLSTIFFALALTAERAISKPFENIGVNIGNKQFQEAEKSSDKIEPLLNFVTNIVIMPPLEEGIFRGIPNLTLIALKAKGPQWKLGLPMASVFAASHNVHWNEQGDTLFSADTLPAVQFAGGAFVWKLMRDRGWLHAVVAHSVCNVLYLGRFYATGKV